MVEVFSYIYPFLIIAFGVISLAKQLSLFPLFIGFCAYNYPYLILSLGCMTGAQSSCSISSIPLSGVYLLTFLVLFTLLPKINQTRVTTCLDTSLGESVLYSSSTRRYSSILLVILLSVFALRLCFEGFSMFTYRAMSIPGEGKPYLLKLLSSYSYTLILFSFVASYLERNTFALRVGFLLLAITFVTGDRTYPAIAIFSFLFAYCCSQRSIRILKGTSLELRSFGHLTLFIACLVSLVFIGLLGKSIYGIVTLALVSGDTSALVNSFSNLSIETTSSEAEHLFGITELLVINNIETAPELFFSSLASVTLPFSKLFLDTNSNYFPDAIKSLFFAHWGEGMSPGAPFLGHIYSVGGLVAVASASIIIYLLYGTLASSFKSSSSVIACSFYASIAGYIAFYIYRNSADQILVSLKRIVVSYIVTLAIVRIFRQLPSTL